MIELSLLPCPFCGSDPEPMHIGNYATKSQKIKIRCPECRIERTDAILNRGSKGMDWLRGVAEKNWNTRSTNEIPVSTDSLDDPEENRHNMVGRLLEDR